MFALLLFIMIAYGQAFDSSLLRGSDSSSHRTMEQDFTFPSPETEYAWNLDKAKMAVSNTIEHYLSTGEWKEVCDMPDSYVFCIKMDTSENGMDHSLVLHRNHAMKGVLIDKDDAEQLVGTVKSIFQDSNKCTCDHNSFWTLSSYEWSDSDAIGNDFMKTALVTKVYGSDRNGVNYKPCSPQPDDDVYVCGQGVWNQPITTSDLP